MAVAKKRQKMKRTQVSFPLEQYENVRRIARRKGVSLAEVVRQGAACLEQQDQEEHRRYVERMMSIVGIVKNAGPDDAEKHDEIIYGPGLCGR